MKSSWILFTSYHLAWVIFQWSDYILNFICGGRIFIQVRTSNNYWKKDTERKLIKKVVKFFLQPSRTSWNKNKGMV